MKHFVKLAITASFLVSCMAAAAPEAPLTPGQRAQAIDDIAAAFEKTYVFPEVGDAVARDLRRRRDRGEYDRIVASRELAARLSRDIDAICRDSHTEVAYMEEDQLAQAAPASPAAAKQREEARRAQARADNYGFAEPRRLDGNIALVRFDGFYPAQDAAPFVHRLMSGVADADALIFDLRENGGGSPQLIAVLASYLYDDTPVHLYDQYDRRLGTRHAAWTDPSVPGERFGGSKPVYILTSAQTFSAAENLAYTLQKLGRAKVVGERTRGGAHGGFGRPVTSHLVPMIATRRVIHAVTKSDWDRVGVIPDVRAPAKEALAAAVALAKKDIAAGRPACPDRTGCGAPGGVPPG
ncbi:MAG: S41 family peptidase [Pseudomonadota bacterium]